MKKLLVAALVAGALLFSASPASARPAPKPNKLTKIYVAPLPPNNCRLVVVPNVVGLDLGRALLELSAFTNVIAFRTPAPADVPSRTVVAQDPVGGTVVSKCSQIILGYKG